MKKILLIPILLLLCAITANAQNDMDGVKQPVDYFKLPFETQLDFTGQLNNDISYWIGFDKKKYYNDSDLGTVLNTAAMHIVALKDSLDDPYMQKKLRIVLYPNGKTVAFHLIEKNIGKEFAYYNGSYTPLRTAYDTLEIVQLKKKAKKDDDKQPYVLYTFTLKDINDLVGAVNNIQLVAIQQEFDKKVKNKSGFLSNYHSDLGFGINVNSYIPIGIEAEVGYYYAFGKSNVGKNIVGIYLSGNVGAREDSLMAMSNICIEFGSAKIVKDRMLQKASFLVGIQFRSKLSKGEGKPVFCFGMNLPATQNLSAGLIFGTDFKKDYNNLDRRTNIGVTFTYHF